LIPTKEYFPRGAPIAKKCWKAVIAACKLKGSVMASRSKGDVVQKLKEVPWDNIVRMAFMEPHREENTLPEYAAVMDIPIAYNIPTMRPPNDLGVEVWPRDSDNNLTANIGYADGFVNFHMDLGFAGLSVLSGNCEKLWVCAPPHPNNVKALIECGPKFAKLVPLLKNVTFIKQTSSHVIFLPPGTIYATFTIAGGILWGNSFRTYEGIWGAAAGLIVLLKDGEKGEVDKEEKRDVLQGWITFMTEVITRGVEGQVNEVGAVLKSRLFIEAVTHGFARQPILTWIDTYFPKLTRRYQTTDVGEYAEDDASLEGLDDDTEGEKDSTEPEEGTDREESKEDRVEIPGSSSSSESHNG